MRLFLYALIGLLFVPACAIVADGGEIAFENNAWRLVFANDETGAPTAGAKAALIDAVREGKPVRIYTSGRRIEHAVDAQFLSIFEDEVFAQISPIEAQRPITEPTRILFRQPGQKWRMIIGTNGTVTALMDGNEPNERNGGATWFVQD